MEYKLFLFGKTDTAKLVFIPGDFNLRVDAIIYLKDKRYKVLEIRLIATEINFNDEGNRGSGPVKSVKNDLEALMSAPIPELYVTEIPAY